MSQSFKKTAATYWRLLSYVRPYWKVLTVGIIAGMLVGGSLFVTLMLLPKMVGAVDPGASAAVVRTAPEGPALL